jgi:hypothetical protein
MVGIFVVPSCGPVAKVAPRFRAVLFDAAFDALVPRGGEEFARL